MRPHLSICIPTRNRAAYLERCLNELAAVPELPFSAEIVVSDNASSDETAAVCARFSTRLPLRTVRHREDVGAERNVVCALRAARGRYCVYLGDDDRLDLARLTEVIALFDDNPGLVCVQAPWRTHDDAANRGHGLFYRLSEPAAFTASQAWPCWQFLLKHRVFPEIAVYRTDDLHAVLHLPRSVHWAFVWCFRLLGRGTIAFLPVPFYVHVVRPAADLPPREQEGVSQSTTHLDRYRGGLEWSLAAALRQIVGHVPEEHRIRAMRELDAFMAERADVAARVAASQSDFIAATEHFTRGRVWEPGVDRERLHQFETEHCMLAGLQAVVETAKSSAGCRRLLLWHVDNVDRVQAIITELFGWEGQLHPIRPGEHPPVLSTHDVVLVMASDAKDAAVQAGALPGRVLRWDQVVDCFRVHNVLGAIARTHAA